MLGKYRLSTCGASSYSGAEDFWECHVQVHVPRTWFAGPSEGPVISSSYRMACRRRKVLHMMAARCNLRLAHLDGLLHGRLARDAQQPPKRPFKSPQIRDKYMTNMTRMEVRWGCRWPDKTTACSNPLEAPVKGLENGCLFFPECAL